MVFSNTTTNQGLVQECEFLASTGASQISGVTANLQTFTRLLNSRYHQIVTMILDSMDEWDFDDANKSDYPVLTTSLVASQQDYSLPTSLKALRIKRVEVSYDGAKWFRMSPLDVNEVGDPTDTTTIANDFNAASPFYDVQFNSLWLYPIPTSSVTGGLKIWISREITEFSTTDTTMEPGFDEPFHRMLAIGAALDWCIAKQLPQKNDLAALWQDYEARLRRYYGSKDADRVYTLKSAYESYK